MVFNTEQIEPNSAPLRRSNPSQQSSDTKLVVAWYRRFKSTPLQPSSKESDELQYRRAKLNDPT